MSFTTDTKEGLAEAIEIMGVDFTWNSEPHRGIQSQNGATFNPQAGGFLPDGNFSIVCLKDHFTTFPSSGNTITLANETFRITRPPNTSEDDPGFELFCEGTEK